MKYYEMNLFKYYSQKRHLRNKQHPKTSVKGFKNICLANKLERDSGAHPLIIIVEGNKRKFSKREDVNNTILGNSDACT